MKKKIIIVVLIIGIIFILVGVGYNILSISKPNDNGKETSNDNTEISVKKYDPDSGKAKSSDSEPKSEYYEKKDDGSMINNSEKVVKKHTKDDFTVEDLNITLASEEEFFANYSFVLKNTGKKDYSNLEFSIVFIFEDGSRLIGSPTTIDNLKAGKSKKIERKEYRSILGAIEYDIEYNVK
ncbi:MAG: hypothetical protein Q4E69_02500 [Bacilli bacterium]|nr:hypothetical protein [Bacilli bacterium]